MEKRWVFGEKQPPESIQKLSESINVNAYLAEILINRGIDTFEKAKAYFRPSLDQLHDPFLMKNLDQAVNRLTDAVFNNEKILVYGDYDVDGTTSVALVYGFLKQFTENLSFYIPDRHKEGYGISEKAVNMAAEEDVSLMISIDCGIRAISQAALAKSHNIDLIICDHHLPGEILPEAYAILDPKQSDCHYPYDELSGCGVGFKLLQGFCLQNTIDIHKLYNFLDLLAVSIASDIVPMTGENRVLAYYGLKKLNQAPSPGLKGLMEVAGLKKDLTISNVVFGIGPRINAAGRIGHALDAVKLLISDSEEEVEANAKKIDFKNSERKDLDKTITQEAIDLIEGDDLLRSAKSTVLFKNDWHKGVIGIVASRCIEKYYRPTIIFTESNNMATGSARSVDGFNIHDAIAECSDLLDQFGGHMHAAGLTLPIDRVELFRDKFESVVASKILPEQLIPQIKVDLEVPFNILSFKFQQLLSQMAPFGPKNLEPLLVSRGLILKYPLKVLKEEHLKMTVTHRDGKLAIDAIAFGFGEMASLLESATSFDMAYHLGINEYLGNKTLQLMVQDIKVND